MPTILKHDKGSSYVYINFRDADDADDAFDDFKRILVNMRLPRESRVLDNNSPLDQMISSLPNPDEYDAFSVSGYRNIGNGAMDHLHLLPDSIRKLDFMCCEITASACKTLCDFLKGNTSITNLYMGADDIGDEGVKHLSDMLCVNTTLTNLHLYETSLGTEAFRHLSRGLSQNNTLTHLCLANGQEMNADEHIALLCPGLAVNRGLEYLSFCDKFQVTMTGLVSLEIVNRENRHLKAIYLGFKCWMSYYGSRTDDIYFFLRAQPELICQWTKRMRPRVMPARKVQLFSLKRKPRKNGASFSLSANVPSSSKRKKKLARRPRHSGTNAQRKTSNKSPLIMEP